MQNFSNSGSIQHINKHEVLGLTSLVGRLTNTKYLGLPSLVGRSKTRVFGSAGSRKGLNWLSWNNMSGAKSKGGLRFKNLLEQYA